MFFGRKINHPLPKFPPDVAPAFRAMCETIADEAKLQELREAVSAALLEISQQARGNANVNMECARALADASMFLLEHYGEYPPKLQALIIGAVRYFAVADDPFDDSVFSSGLFDDAKVMNHVLEKLGIEDRYIE